MADYDLYQALLDGIIEDHHQRVTVISNWFHWSVYSLRSNQRQRCLANRRRQTVPSRDHALQISVKRRQTMTIETAGMQRPCSAALWAAAGSRNVIPACVKISQGFKSPVLSVRIVRFNGRAAAAELGPRSIKRHLRSSSIRLQPKLQRHLKFCQQRQQDIPAVLFRGSAVNLDRMVDSFDQLGQRPARVSHRTGRRMLRLLFSLSLGRMSTDKTSNDGQFKSRIRSHNWRARNGAQHLH
jgi:hypothetical protein